MCLICDRIEMIKAGTNPYFVRELETGYVVLGDHQYFKGYTLFLCKEHKQELFELETEKKIKGHAPSLASVPQTCRRSGGVRKGACMVAAEGENVRGQ